MRKEESVRATVRETCIIYPAQELHCLFATVHSRGDPRAENGYMPAVCRGRASKCHRQALEWNSRDG